MSRKAILTVLFDEFSDDLDVQSCGNILNNITRSSAALSTVAAACSSFEGSSEDPTHPTRIRSYVESVVPLYSNDGFYSHFRMKRSTFETLCTVVAPRLTDRTVAVEKKVLSTLWLLGNQESYRGVADRFDFSKGSHHRVCLEVCSALVDVQAEYIRWPNSADYQKIADGFQSKTGFPGVIGALDGTHIAIPGPKEHRDSYINRKGFPSIQLQVVCDSNLQLLDVYTGWPGSVHDARVYRNSPIAQLIPTFPNSFHLLGDSAYPLSTNLLVPYRDNGHLTPLEKKYNKVHASTRVDVERAIGLLKCKWRRLKHLDMISIDKIPNFIIAACVLHNFVLELEKFDERDVEINVDGQDMDNDTSEHTHSVPADAQHKRLQVTNLL